MVKGITHHHLNTFLQPSSIWTSLCGHLCFLGHITTTNPASPVIILEILTSLTHIQPNHILREIHPVPIQDVSPQCLYESEYPHTNFVNSSKQLKQIVSTGSLFCPSTSNS